MELVGKTALVTGSSRGIGAAIARTFADPGRRLLLCTFQSVARRRGCHPELECGPLPAHLYRKNVSLQAPEPGMAMINLARAATALGEPVMGDDDLAVYISAFETLGFTGGINWHLLGEVDPFVRHPALMIYGDRDVTPKFEKLADFVPNLDVVSLDCGHWVQEEKPEETNQAIPSWLVRQSCLIRRSLQAILRHAAARFTAFAKAAGPCGPAS